MLPLTDTDIVSELFKMRFKNKTSIKAAVRPDVNDKTLFRALRNFYKVKLDQIMPRRKKRCPRPDVL